MLLYPSYRFTMHSSMSKRKRVLSRLLRIIGGIACMALVLGLLVFNALLVWVATGPRDLSRALPYIQESLNSKESGFTVSVNKGLLLWDGWQHPLDIRLKGVEVRTKDGVRFATFPDVSLGLDLLSLTYGKVRPTSLVIRRPVISLYQSESGAVTFGFPEAEAPPPAADAPSSETQTAPEGQVALMATIAGFFNGTDELGLHDLTLIEISDASISVGNAKGVFLRANDVNLEMKHGWRGGKLAFGAVVQQEKTPARLRISLSQPRGSKGVEGMVQVQSLLPQTVNHFLHSPVLAAVEAPLSGWVSATIGEEGKLSGGRFLLTLGAGRINSPELQRPVSFTQLQAEGQLPAQNTIIINKLSGALEEGKALLAHANVEWREDGDAALSGEATLKNAKISDIGVYWPPNVAPMSRSWVVTNLKSGDIPQAGIRFNIQFGDLKQPTLPEQAIDATMAVTNLTASYLEGHDDIRAASGSARITGKSLEVLIDKGTTMKATRLAAGRVYIDDLNLENPLIELRFDAAASASDMVHLLSLPPIEAAAKLQLKENAIRGEVTGSAKLSFYYFTPPGPDGKPRADMGVTYDVNGTIRNGAQDGFMGKFDVSALTGTMQVNNETLHFKGSGGVNGATADAEVEYLFTPKDGFDTWVKVDGRAPVSSLKRFGYPEFSFLSGAFGIKAELRSGNAKEASKASFDLTDTVIDWKEAQWLKVAGQPASLSLAARKDAGAVYLSDIAFRGNEAEAAGEAELNDALTGVKSLSLSRVRWGRNDLALHYEAIPGGHRVEAKGASADVTPWMKNGSSDFSFEHFPTLELDVDLARFYMKKDHPADALTGSVRCNQDICSSADIRGTAGGKPFSFKIAQSSAGVRRLEARAENAGAFLKVFDLYDTMSGGTLALNGVFDGDALAGKLTVSEFTIENAPTLAKLLTLSSLPSLVDTMQGKGIAFRKLNAPFALKDDVITLRDAKAYGSAIGITADGTLTFPGEIVSLKGTLVPSYTLNTVLGNVPLLGDLITGGGEGVIAARYTMTGAGDKTDVSVNPLSLLTPGFLRGLFDVFEAPEKPADKKLDDR